MKWLRWLVIALALVEAGYMLFDGGRALVLGDYITPTSGAFAGQLGPWANVVSAVGIEPRSLLMKWIFVLYGAAWLSITVLFIQRVRGTRGAMLAAAIGSTWYMWIGTVLSAIQTVLLVMPRAAH